MFSSLNNEFLIYISLRGFYEQYKKSRMNLDFGNKSIILNY